MTDEQYDLISRRLSDIHACASVIASITSRFASDLNVLEQRIAALEACLEKFARRDTGVLALSLELDSIGDDCREAKCLLEAKP